MRLLGRIEAGIVATGLVMALAACGGDDGSSASTSSGPTPTSSATTTAPSTSAPVTTPRPTTTVAPTTTAPVATTAPTTTTPTPPTTTNPPSLTDVRIYFLRGERLVSAHRGVPGTAVLRGALDQLVAGPTADERDVGLGTTVPAGTTVLGVDLGFGRATVDLSDEFDDGGGTLSMQARVAQIVFTATQFPNVDGVEFWMEGEPIDTLGGEGLILDEPQTRAMMPREVTGAVIVDTPHPGDTVTSPIRVTGEADVYEAQFPIEIWRDGVQIGGLAPVTGGAWGTWGDFDVTIPIDAAPGPIELVTYDEGGCGDGPECPEPIRTVVPLVLAG